MIGEHVRADFDILSLKVNSAGQTRLLLTPLLLMQHLLACVAPLLLLRGGSRRSGHCGMVLEPLPNLTFAAWFLHT